MRHTRIDRILYMSAAIAVVLATASVTWAKVNRRPPSMYVPGERFGPVPELSLPEGGDTLVAWIDSRCGACTASMPFYSRLTALAKHTQVVLLGREPAGDLRDYASAYDVKPAHIVSVGDLPLKFAGTPTLVLVGPDAVVRAVWFGRRETIEQEAEVIARIK